jgi:hypothetical protein
MSSDRVQLLRIILEIVMEYDLDPKDKIAVVWSLISTVTETMIYQHPEEKEVLKLQTQEFELIMENIFESGK